MEKQEERYLSVPDYRGFPTWVPASKAVEFQKEQEELRQKVESGKIPDPRDTEEMREFNRKLEEMVKQRKADGTWPPKTEK